MASGYDTDLTLAHQLADAAEQVAMSFFKGDFRHWFKEGDSIVTEADLATEDAIRTLIGSRRPDDAVLGEERGQTGTSGRRWIVDAIDGTRDFADGSNDWGTLIALEVDGELVVGVATQPAHARRYWAARGGGAFETASPSAEPRRLRVSGNRDLRSARSYIPLPKWVPTVEARAIADALIAATQPVPHSNHPALQVARGEYEFAVWFSGGPWDMAAPAIIVEEAGGRFTDLRGRHDVFGGGAVFSNGFVHDEVVRVIAQS
jgi:histidinol-phosphatase